MHLIYLDLPAIYRSVHLTIGARMPISEIEFRLCQVKDDRNLTRRRVVDTFFAEKPGNGRGDNASRYRYNVERLHDGKRIYLQRPANLHNGFDFVIHVEDSLFPRPGLTKTGKPKTPRSNPSHENILDDLRKKTRPHPDAARPLLDAIERVFHCEEPDRVLKESRLPKGLPGYSVEMVLKVIKWFFLEQDIRYWNYSGREMFMGAVRECLTVK